MIISASRRTDIPAFYGDWFMDKVRRSYCLVANPFNPRQVKKVSLKREDVDLFVFWTKNPEPFLPHLEELDSKGYPFYFLYTLNPYCSTLEPGLEELEKRIEVFQKLAGLIGKEKVIWRYDPIIISPQMNFHYHLENFRLLVDALKDATTRVIISFYSPYRSADRRLKKAGIQPLALQEKKEERRAFLKEIATIAGGEGITVTGCAQGDLEGTGVFEGKCIDDKFIYRVFGLEFPPKKDPGQRPECRCIASQDIGAYDTCQQGCIYCYAWSNRKNVETQRFRESISLPSLGLK